MRRFLQGTLAAMAIALAGATPAVAEGQGFVPDSERLDTDARRVVAELTSFDPPPLYLLAAPVARQLPGAADAARRVAEQLGRRSLERVAVKRQVVLAGPGGQAVARVFVPRGPGPFPILVHFPGGGWTITSLNAYEPSARALANASRHIVVLPTYRSAPETKFPGQVEDAYATFQYVARNAASFGGIPGRTSVGGESAGGNLAAVTAILSRDRGGLRPLHQLLVYPITNFDFTSESYRTEAESIPLDRPTMQYFWANYLASPADGASPLASPLRAELRGLPPATVITAENDVLRSEGEAYAQRLRAAGVRVDAARYAGTMHEFFGMTTVVRDARRAVDRAGRNLRRAAASASRRARGKR